MSDGTSSYHWKSNQPRHKRVKSNALKPRLATDRPWRWPHQCWRPPWRHPGYSERGGHDRDRNVSYNLCVFSAAAFAFNPSPRRRLWRWRQGRVGGDLSSESCSFLSQENASFSFEIKKIRGKSFWIVSHLRTKTSSLEKSVRKYRKATAIIDIIFGVEQNRGHEFSDTLKNFF